MTRAARATPSPRASPSAIACAKPWIDVSGVRSSCEMSARNACSLVRARSISPAISLNAPPSSRTSAGPPTGARARLSDVSARPPPTSRRSGAVIVRARSPATTSAKPAAMTPAMTSEGRRARITSAKTARGRAMTMNPCPPAPKTAVRSCCCTKIHTTPSASVNWPMPVASGSGSRVFSSVPSLSRSTRRCALAAVGLLPGLTMRTRSFSGFTCSSRLAIASRGCCPCRTAVWIAVWNGAASSSSRIRVTSFSYLNRSPPIARPATSSPTATTARYERKRRPAMLRGGIVVSVPSARSDQELISHAPDGLDHGACGGELVAQLLHVDVDGPRLAGVREAPDVLEQLVPRQDDARLAAEGLEQLELLRPQRDRRPGHGHFVSRGVEQEVPDLERTRPSAAGGAADDRVDPRDELARVERLGEVVVEPGVEAGHLLTVLGASGEREHGRIVHAAELRDEVPAVGV